MLSDGCVRIHYTYSSGIRIILFQITIGKLLRRLLAEVQNDDHDHNVQLRVRNECHWFRVYFRQIIMRNVLL